MYYKEWKYEFNDWKKPAKAASLFCRLVDEEGTFYWEYEDGRTTSICLAANLLEDDPNAVIIMLLGSEGIDEDEEEDHVLEVLNKMENSCRHQLEDDD